MFALIKLVIVRAALSLKLIFVLAAGLVFSQSVFAQVRRSRVANLSTDNINAIQFSPDGNTLAIAWGADENRVELWDTQSGDVRRTIRGFDGPVWSVSFSPDNRTLVTASGGTHKEKIAEKTTHRNSGRWFTELKWWDWRTGELVQRFELTDDEVINIVAGYSPDGRVLAVVENRLLTGLSGSDYYGSWGSWSTILRRGTLADMGGYFYSRLRLVDAHTGAPQLKLKDGYNAVQVPVMVAYPGDFMWLGAMRRLKPMVFSPDGQLVAAWKAKEARIWNSASGTEVLKINQFKGRLVAIAFSPDGHLLAGAIERVTVKESQAEFKTEIRVWEVATGAPKQVFPSHTHSISTLIFANNGQQLLIGGLQFDANRTFASMELVNLDTGSVGKIVSNEEGSVSSMALSPGGGALAFQIGAETVKLVETRNWRTLQTFSSHDEASGNKASLSRFLVSVKSVPAVAFLADGKTVAGAIEEGGVKLWDARTGEVKKTLAVEAETGSVAVISRDGGTVAEIASDQAVRVWDVASGTARSVTSDKISSIGLSADGKVLAIAEAGRILVVSTRDLKTSRVISGVESPISLIALSSDGKDVAAAVSGLLKIWSTDDGVLRQTIPVGGEVSALQFGPADQIAIGRKDGRGGLWSLSRGTINVELRKHTAAINAISFSADGTLVVTGGDDRSAIIWECATGRTLRTLKGHDLAITSLAFSPEGATLAVGTGNASVVLWRMDKGKLDRVLK